MSDVPEDYRGVSQFVSFFLDAIKHYTAADLRSMALTENQYLRPLGCL